MRAFPVAIYKLLFSPLSTILQGLVFEMFSAASVVTFERKSPDTVT